MQGLPASLRGRAAVRRGFQVTGHGHDAGPRVDRAVERCHDPATGLESGHYEIARVWAGEYDAALAADPALSGFGWSAFGDRMIGHRWVPRVVVTLDNMDALLAHYCADTGRRRSLQAEQP